MCFSRAYFDIDVRKRVYICTPPYEFLIAAQLSHRKRRGTKPKLRVMSFLNRQSSDFFFSFWKLFISLSLFHLALLLLPLQGPQSAINFNT